jgi:membrane protein implicated in regulation of membrane protease activity
MLDWFVFLGHWNWFIAAVVFLLIEVLAPGIFMLWLGLSALLVGIVSAAVAWPWQGTVHRLCNICPHCGARLAALYPEDRDRR